MPRSRSAQSSSDPIVPRIAAARACWGGHLPAASARLLPILRSAVRGDREFTRAERILYTVCEFWAAVEARTLASLLGPEAVDALRGAATAFSEIGAVSVAGRVKLAVNDLAMAAPRRQRRARLHALEEDLHRTADPVDQLIARFAERLEP